LRGARERLHGRHARSKDVYPCKGGIPPLTTQQAEGFHRQVPPGTCATTRTRLSANPSSAISARRCASCDVPLSALPARADRVDDYVHEQMRLRHVPGLALAVVRDERVVVVVAEGAGQDLIADLPTATDPSGNKRPADVGPYLKRCILEHFARVQVPVDVKYFDPSYIIRSTAANCDDALLYDQLARNAAHAAVAGKTNLIIGLCNGAFTHIPIPLAIAEKKQLDPEGLLWTSVLEATNQPRAWT